MGCRLGSFGSRLRELLSDDLINSDQIRLKWVPARVPSPNGPLASALGQARVQEENFFSFLPFTLRPFSTLVPVYMGPSSCFFYAMDTPTRVAPGRVGEA